MVVVGIFTDRPAIKHLVHDEEAHAVAEVEELRRWGIVRGADGVDTEGAQGIEAALPDGGGNGDADCAAVTVQGYPVDFVLTPLSQKPVAASK